MFKKIDLHYMCIYVEVNYCDLSSKGRIYGGPRLEQSFASLLYLYISSSGQKLKRASKTRVMTPGPGITMPP